MAAPSTTGLNLRSQGAIATLRSGVVIEDAAGRIVAVNQSFCRIWKLPVDAASLIGRRACDVGRPAESLLAEPIRALARLHALAEDRVPVFEEGLRRNDGLFVDVDYIPLQHGDGYGGCYWIYRVLADSPRADEEIRTHNRDLEQRVLERTQELARTNFDLEASLRRLGQTQEQLIHAGKMAAVGTLVAGLSHELNNPLGIIVGYAQGLLRRAPPDAPGRESLAAIERQALRCAHLVRSLLDFSRSSRSHPEETAVPPLVERVIELATGQARRRQINLRWMPRPPLPILISRPQDIESVLMNLVSNAIDATPAGGSVTLSAAPMPRAGRPGLEISVIDTGSGIPPEVLPRIFDPFFTTKPIGEGTGIGLPLSRQAIEAHGGTIEVRTAEGIGTTMRVWLPLSPQPSAGGFVDAHLPESAPVRRGQAADGGSP
jgi:signal transduction histidine kinase